MIWAGLEGPEIVASFLQTLLVSLRLDLAYARVEDPRNGPTIEAVRADGQPGIAHCAHEIGLELAPALLPLHGAREAVAVPNPVGSGMLRPTAVPLDSAEQAVVVAASHRDDFPTDFESALL